MVYSDSASRKERCCSIPYGCQRPVRGEASLEAKAYVGRRPTPKALEGGRETDTEENIGSIDESIPDGWRPEPSPPAGRSPEAKASVEARGLPSRRAKLCLCLSLTQTLSHTQKDGETETNMHTAKHPTRSAVERRASIHSQRCLPRSIPTVTLLFIIIVCSSPVHVRNFYIPAIFIK